LLTFCASKMKTKLLLMQVVGLDSQAAAAVADGNSRIISSRKTQRRTINYFSDYKVSSSISVFFFLFVAFASFVIQVMKQLCKFIYFSIIDDVIAFAFSSFLILACESNLNFIYFTRAEVLCFSRRKKSDSIKETFGKYIKSNLELNFVYLIKSLV